MYPTVEEFIKSGQRNAHTYQDGVVAYVRSSRRIVPGSDEVVPCFDIANVRSDVEGRGDFTRWLDNVIKLVEDSKKYSALYVEIVHADRFARFFEKRGWISARREDEKSFFRICGRNDEVGGDERSPP